MSMRLEVEWNMFFFLRETMSNKLSVSEMSKRHNLLHCDKHIIIQRTV